MHHQTRLLLAWRRKLDMLADQLGELFGFNRQQLARRDGEVGFVESQWARVALPGDFVTIDDDGGNICCRTCRLPMARKLSADS
jgi:hypothetical protein